MEDIKDWHSDTSSEAASSISTCIIRSYENEPPMNKMTEWVKWRAPKLAIPQWMKEELKKCEDVNNVTRRVRAITKWLDNTSIAQGSLNT